MVGGDLTILKNDGVRQWVSDEIPHMKWKITHVSNHHPDHY
jgi:predicted membrane-bound dolichyl-phosphate-mannose-protein mannosyltransferase